MKQFYVYILGNEKPVLYIGVTNNLVRRIQEHKSGLIDGFSREYSLKKLLYYEITENIEAAINREKQLKKWNRKWKLELIIKVNPQFNDLYYEILKQI